MALDRQSIEKKDFPIGRRGYDPEAVDAHLREVADAFDTIRRSARQRSETVATAASEQVRAIIAAAEASASEITRQAEEEARDIRDDADAEATRTRDEANQHAHDYVGRVAEATSALLQRVDAMQGELNTLLDTLRTGAHRVNADLQLLEGNLGELSAATGRARYAPEPAETGDGDGDRVAVEDPDAPHRDGAADADRDRLVADPDAPSAPAAGTPAPDAIDPDAPAPAEPEAATAAVPEPAGGEGEEGARLVALDMALSGTPREETERYLAEHFDLADRDTLLDEVYASVGG